jgi:hypothetical protein
MFFFTLSFLLSTSTSVTSVITEWTCRIAVRYGDFGQTSFLIPFLVAFTKRELLFVGNQTGGLWEITGDPFGYCDLISNLRIY